MNKTISRVVRGRRGVSAVLGVALAMSPSTAEADDLCRWIARQSSATTIAYGPGSQFTICRDGHVESDVVAGRPVYVEIVPGAGIDLLRFRVHGQSTRAEPTGLRALGERMRHLHDVLHALASSGETIHEASDGSGPLSALDQGRMLYLGVATPGFHEALASASSALESLAPDTGLLSRWCAELTPVGDPSALVTAELRQQCGDEHVTPERVGREAAAMAQAIDAYRAARDRAREGILVARARPDEGASQRAISLLDEARNLAVDVARRAAQLDPVVHALGAKAATLREIVREGPGALTPGVPQYLTRFQRGGIGRLQIDSVPVDLATQAPTDHEDAESSRTFQFPVVSLHFLDVEVGVAGTAAPQAPAIAPQGKIEGQNVDEFVGLALVELEPARFLWPDRPLAGLLRLPVVGIPFTRDPTRNFFVGAGIGWTGVGSISAGPYLLRELALDSGHGFGDAVQTGTSIETVASPALRVGSFISASVDLMGLAHFFFTPKEPTLDATTGAEVVEHH